MGEHGQPVRVIIDTDPGIDDAMAILAAFNSPDIQVIGLTSIYGNVPTRMATSNAVFLCELAGRPDVPVAQGALRSLRGAAKERIADFVHGADGFGNTGQQPPLGGALLGECAAEFIVRMSRLYPGELVVLALGALTNLALAFHLDAGLPDRLARVVVLGGAFRVSGNVNPAAEANMFGDPDAANVVFGRAPNCWVVGLDVTHECRLTGKQIDDLAVQGRHGAFLSRITQFYLQYHRDTYAQDAVFVHDATALAAVVRPDLFTWQRASVLVLADGPAKGHTIMDGGRKKWVGANDWQPLPVASVAVGVDSAALQEWVLDRMAR